MGYCHLFSLFFTLSLLSGCLGSSENTGYHPGPKVLRRRSDDDSLYCESWKFSVENGDAGQGLLVPSRCEKFVKNYMTGERYLSDSEFVANHSITFAKSVTLAGDGLDCWIFDVDDTLLSTLPYLAKIGYGSKVPNVTLAYEWVSKAVAPALPQTLRLYNELKKLNFTLIVLTGRSEIYRAITQKNLLFAGYKHWHKLILREASAKGPYTATVFKSKKRQELEAQGYRIHGSSGDQWSDLLGNATAVRSFKLPNPMYTVA